MTLESDFGRRLAGFTRRDALFSLASVASLAAVGGRARPRAAGLRRTPADEPEILAAVRAGDRPAVARLLGADPARARARDEAGRSALVVAHLAGHRTIAALLRQHLSELDVVEAVVEREWDRAVALLEADPELARTAHPIGGTPLYAGAIAGAGQLYRLRALGCHPDAAPAGGTGFTPARGALEAADLASAWTSLSELLGNGADVNAAQRGGDSVLHGAVRRRSQTLVRLALRKGADPAARDRDGRTAEDLAGELGWEAGVALLHNHAAVPRDHRASRFLCDANREPVVVPDISDIPQAIQNDITGKSHFDVAKVTEHLKSDARRVWSVSTDAELAIEACAHTGNAAIMRLHLDHGAPLSLPTAVSLGDVVHARFLLEQDPRSVNERGAHDFPLMYYTALGTGSTELAELLVAHGADVDQETQGSTTLHWCVMRDHVDLARWLIEHGADVNAVGHVQDRAGHTPLQLAREKGRDRIATLLTDAGAKV